MKNALIGYTGFVGSNLLTRGGFTHLYNSANITHMAGESFDEVVCAGISAVKWAANKDPEGDWRQIEPLLRVLENVEATRFTLISTIDVYPDPSSGFDETHEPSAAEGAPYGRHRLMVEDFVRRNFRDVLIARLPGLFGPGLKKNIIFDLLNDNQVESINPTSSFQWYPLTRLADDLETSWDARLTLVNLFPEPVATRTIIDAFFPHAKVGAALEPAPNYALTTIHANVFQGSQPFLMSKAAVLAELGRFIEEARGNSVAVGGR